MSASVLLPSIGPILETANAPAAFASSSASRKAKPDEISVTKVPQKQSPAPVGSAALTQCAATLWRSPSRWMPVAPSSPCFSTTYATPFANSFAAKLPSSSPGNSVAASSSLGRKQEQISISSLTVAK